MATVLSRSKYTQVAPLFSVASTLAPSHRLRTVSLEARHQANSVEGLARVPSRGTGFFSKAGRPQQVPRARGRRHRFQPRRNESRQ